VSEAGGTAARRAVASSQKEMDGMAWKGIIPVVTTPFDADFEVDLAGYGTNIERLIGAGVHGIIALATAGEGPSLSRAEATAVVARAVEVAAGRVPVLAGLGGPNERDTVELMGLFGGMGVDGFMVVTPYFYPLTRSEMLDAFRRVGRATPLPFMIYNSTYANLPLVPDALEELAADLPNFIALKEGNQLQASDVVRRLGDRVAVFTARDLYLHELMAVGGAGGVAFCANVVPDLAVALYHAAERNDLAAAREIQDRLNPLIWQLVRRSFPAPIKAAMDMVGAVGGRVRPPLSALTESEVGGLRAVLDELGVLAR
jgi:4-hydroxy-tetrahydrodipicolinate synthase